MTKIIFFGFTIIIYFMAVAILTEARPEKETLNHFDNEEYMHPKREKRDTISIKKIRSFYEENEESAAFWNKKAQHSLKEHLNKRVITKPAKNVILFLGDGMSIPTLGAARVYAGQLFGELGENTELSFETFPYTGLSKTYCVDSQVADSACSATAYLCGVKNNIGTIGISAAVPRGDCQGNANSSNHVDSIAYWSQNAGKSTGIVTTTRVTHASPSGTYAHIADRDWESDYNILQDGNDPKICPDIATQLITRTPGENFKVILGGGRREFLPDSEIDEEGHKGRRKDGVNLINKWKQKKISAGKSYNYVWNRDGLQNVDINNTDYLLGLFESSHCQYHLDADLLTEPTLTEMTEVAIKMLSKDDKGFFLFVEGGRIDHGHHDTLAKKALDETVQMAEAVRRATEITNPEETLIVVTSDHAHTMSYAGYPNRGNNILTIAGTSAEDKLPYSTLSYANGPGYQKPDSEGNRHNLTGDDMENKDYKFPALAPLSSETHGGDDVGVFALGPWAHLFTGMYEQNLIPHIMAFASCVGNGLTVCDLQQGI